MNKSVRIQTWCSASTRPVRGCGKRIAALAACLWLLCGACGGEPGSGQNNSDGACGDGVCGPGETCDGCPSDCGACDDGGLDAGMDASSDAGEALPPTRIYVTLVSHNEDTATGQNPDCVAFVDAIDQRFAPNRQALLEIADAVDRLGAAWDFQSDIQYVDLVLAREPSDDNILRTLATHPSGRISVDAHAHESSFKNYADVANRLEEVSGARNGVVGGFSSVICGSQPTALLTWEKFRDPLQPVGGGPAWAATILTDGANPGHVCDEDAAASGVWRPSAEDDFWSDDPGGNLVNIGVGLYGHGLADSLAAITQILQDLRAGRLEPHRLYTSSVTLPQCNFDLPDSGVTPADIEGWIQAVNALDGGQGDLRWATFPQIVEIWRTEYSAQPSLWRGAP